MGQTYKCDKCGGTFEAGWSDEEAHQELRERFGNVPLSECAQVCDDCYHADNDYYVRLHDFIVAEAVKRNCKPEELIVEVSPRGFTVVGIEKAH